MYSFHILSSSSDVRSVALDAVPGRITSVREQNSDSIEVPTNKFWKEGGPRKKALKTESVNSLSACCSQLSLTAVYGQARPVDAFPNTSLNLVLRSQRKRADEEVQVR